MGGPIVRTGTNPKFWEGWNNVFNKKQGAAKPGVRKSGVTGKAGKPKAAKGKKGK